MIDRRDGEWGYGEHAVRRACVVGLPGARALCVSNEGSITLEPNHTGKIAHPHAILSEKYMSRAGETCNVILGFGEFLRKIPRLQRCGW